MKVTRGILGLLIMTAALTPSPTDAAWRAGLGKRNITPSGRMWMSGYASRNRPAEGKLTDLWAKTVVLEDAAGSRFVGVGLDLVGIDRALSVDVRQRIADAHQIPIENVALFTSHTHTGPIVKSNLAAMYELSDEDWDRIDAYAEWLAESIVESVADAVDDLEPCEIAWANGHSDFAVNRRNNREADVPMLRKENALVGPVDHEVPVLSITANGKLKGIVFGYACHATVLSFYEWSGDYPGFAQIELEERHPEAMAIFWAGCGADQNPLPRRTVELARGYGRKLADAVDAVLDGPMQPIEGPLAAKYREVELPFAEIPTREELENRLQSSNKYEVGRARLLLKNWDADGSIPKTYPYPIQVWQLGTGPTWVILGGEVVVDYSLRLKDELGAGTWVAGYANDVIAYIPSERVLREGGYEGARSMIYYGQPSPWSPGLEDIIVGTVHELADKVPEEAASK